MNIVRNKTMSVFVVSALFLLIIPSFSPLVEAARPGGSRIVQQTQTIVVDPDASANWTSLLNIANGSDYAKLDYNLTWLPFFANNTDLEGIVVHNLFSPVLFEPNCTNQSMSLACVFKLAPEQIMDGISEVWFRLPVTEIPYNSTIRARAYRLLFTSGFNISYTAFGTFNALPSSALALQKVYDMTLNPNDPSVFTGFERPDSWVNYTRHLNVSVPGSNNTFYYNWTFLKACFGMFPNEWYLVMFDISSPSVHGMKVCWTTSDFGSDGRYNSWVWVNGQSYYVQADLDMSFVATYGVSNGITGIGTKKNYLPDPVNPNLFVVNASIPIGQTTVNTSHRYFNVLVPFMANMSSGPIADGDHLYVELMFYSTIDETPASALTVPWTTNYHVNSTYSFYLYSYDLNSLNNSYIDHIRIAFSLVSWPPAYPNATMIKFWGVQNAVNDTRGGFTDIYWYGYTGFGGSGACVMSERQWFIPFGYYGLDDWRWTGAEYSLWTIPIVEPSTPQGITEAIQDFEIWLEGTNSSGQVEHSGHWLNIRWDKIIAMIDWTYHTVGKFFAYTFTWAYEHTPLRWLIDWVAGLPNPLDIWNFFKGIGEWLWDVINLIYDALEWFGYWAVRTIYSFSLAIVYVINIFGVISINSALFSYAKSGNGRDFLRAFRAGWSFIYRIIALLISLAIMAIGIVSAVIPL